MTGSTPIAGPHEPVMGTARRALSKQWTGTLWLGISLATVVLAFGIDTRWYEATFALLVLLPLIAVPAVALADRLFHRDISSVFIAVGACAFLIAWRAFHDVQLAEDGPPLRWAIIAAPILAVAATFVSSPARNFVFSVIFFCFLTLPYSWGTIVLANALFDDSMPSVFDAYLQEKYFVRHRRGPDSWDLIVGPWGRMEDPDRISVARQLYQSVTLGDKVHLFVQRGALGAPWYFPMGCGRGALEANVPRSFTALDRIAVGVNAYACRRYDVTYGMLKPAAERGNATAQFFWGWMRLLGRGVPADAQEAMHLFRTLADRGSLEAAYSLGFAYHKGPAEVRDIEAAIKWYRAAADGGEPHALNDLAVLYFRGDNVGRNPDEAYRMWRQSAAAGHAEGMFNIGGLYSVGQVVEKDPAEAARWWRRAADRGHAEAQYALGTLYASGNGVARDDALAAQLFARAKAGGYQPPPQPKSPAQVLRLDGPIEDLFAAASQGHARAQAYLGYRFQTGLGVQQDAAQAVKWYRKSAESGDTYGQYYLGQAHELGLGDAARDFEEAASWYLPAAESGLAVAQERLGILYTSGMLAATDFATGVELLRKAAERNRPDAMNGYGYALLFGQGVERDPAAGLDWLRKAIEFGQPNAMNTLAELSYRGIEMPKNAVEAYYWASLAYRFYPAGPARDQLIRLRSVLESAITPEQKASVAQRVGSFNAKLAPDMEGNPVPRDRLTAGKVN